MGDDSSWLQKWKTENFSWKRLAHRPPWQPEVGGTLQDYLRKFEGDATDNELISNGILLRCGSAGLFHILFVPDEWAKSRKSLGCSPEELREKKVGYWAKLFSNGLRQETFRGEVSGVHLPTQVAQQLVPNSRASFKWTSFDGDLTGFPKRPAREFENCQFKGAVTLVGYLQETPPPSLRFAECVFEADVAANDFSGVRDVAFQGCEFSGRLHVEGKCGSLLRLHNCVLFTFDSLGCVFSEDVEFLEVIVSRRFSLARCTFEKSFSLVSTELSRSFELLDCDFKARVTFVELGWPPHSHLNISAEGSKFHETVSFSAGSIPPTRFFQNAEFKSSVAFSSVRDSELKDAFLKELNAKPRDAVDPNHALAMENGCRTLRKLAEARGDVHQEHFWHRSEIIARRARNESSLSENLFSHLYGWAADYGLSIPRPFLVLIASTAAFAIFYAWIGGPELIGSSINWDSLEEGIGYSLNRMLPIGVFADEGNAWRKAILGTGGELGTIAVRALATLQTVLSAILIYLGVMAVRRKFRIS